MKKKAKLSGAKWRRVRAEAQEFQPLKEILPPDEYSEIFFSAAFPDFTKTADRRPRGRPAGGLKPYRPGECDQQTMLAHLRYDEFRTLKDPEYERLILEAARKDDLQFFIDLGRVLVKEAQEVYRKFGKLEWFLRERWCAQRDGLPELCRLSADGLTAVCRRNVEPQLTRDAVLKTRQRLGLVPAKRGRIHVEAEGGALRFTPSR